MSTSSKALRDEIEALRQRDRELDDELHALRAAGADADARALAHNALSEACNALGGLSKVDIMEIKSMKTPPKTLHTVLTCVATLKGMKAPDKWDTIRRMIADSSFLNSLLTIAWEDLGDAKVARVQALIAEEQMTPETVRRFSRAAEVFLAWTLALIGCHNAMSTSVAHAHASTTSIGAPAQSTADLVWRHLGGTEFERQLAVDSELGAAPIRLVDARYLIELARAGTRLARRQDLPEDAFMPLQTLRRLGLGSSNSLRVVVVSHAWLTPLHPDPRGENLRLLAAALELLVRGLEDDTDEPGELRTYAVMIDFCSALQKGAAGEARSAAEGALFVKALSQMGDWYSHPETIVVKLTRMPDRYPEGYEFPAGTVPNTADYGGRGWCFEEASVAGLVKSSGKVLDLGQYSTSATSLLELKSQCKAGRSPPLTPDEFNLRLETKSFTSRNADLEQVKQLYLHAYQTRLGGATELWLRELGWGDAECELLCAVIASGVLHELGLLVLNHNDLGDDGATALAAQIMRGSLPKLKELSIYGNPPLGTRGLGELCVACDEMGVGLIATED